MDEARRNGTFPRKLFQIVGKYVKIKKINKMVYFFVSVREGDVVNLDLQPNEGMILQTDDVVNCELFLTNLNLIRVQNKGLFGNKKSIQKFPVNQIKVVNGQAQTMLRKNIGSYAQVEVFFRNGQETFEFYKKKEALKWIDAISELLTGAPSQTIQQKNVMAIPGAEQFAGTVKDTFGALKDAFGVKSKNTSSENTTSKCMGCMAPISGRKGETVRCSYCDTKQTL